MSSPAKLRLAALMKQKEERNDQYKPLTSLPRAYLFEVKKFSYKQSNYPDTRNPNGSKPYNLIAHFTFADTNMYTYLPKEFSTINEADIKDTVSIFNKDIEDKEVMKFAYYGVIDNQIKAKLHFGNEGIDEKLVEDVRKWEENNSQSNTHGPVSPKKRSRLETTP